MFNVHRRKMTALLGVLLTMMGSPSFAAETTEVERPPSRWWLDVQLGTVVLLNRPGAMEDSGRGYPHFALQGGVRLNPEWMLGVLSDGGSFGSLSCPPVEYSLCRSRKLVFDDQYLAVIFNPRRGPWLFELAAGRANSDVTQRLSGNSNDRFEANLHGYYPDFGNHAAGTHGSGLRVGVGYDWHRPGARTHLGWRASLDHANSGKLDLGLGSTAYTALNLSLGVSWY